MGSPGTGLIVFLKLNLSNVADVLEGLDRVWTYLLHIGLPESSVSDPHDVLQGTTKFLLKVNGRHSDPA